MKKSLAVVLTIFAVTCYAEGDPMIQTTTHVTFKSDKPASCSDAYSEAAKLLIEAEKKLPTGAMVKLRKLNSCTKKKDGAYLNIPTVTGEITYELPASSFIRP